MPPFVSSCLCGFHGAFSSGFVAPRDLVDLQFFGERGLCLMPIGTRQPPTLIVVLNWAAKFRGK